MLRRTRHLCGTAVSGSGYYFAEVILYQNWFVPLGSIPGNIMQVVVAGIIVVPLASRLKKLAGKFTPVAGSAVSHA